MSETLLTVYQRHFRLLREANDRLKELMEFNQQHSDLWTAEETAEYQRLRGAWEKASNELSEFSPIPESDQQTSE